MQYFYWKISFFFKKNIELKSEMWLNEPIV